VCIRGLTKTYWRRKWVGRAVAEVQAVRGVDLDLFAGRTIAVVGASGAGKSTLARCIAGIDPRTSGEIFYRGDALENPAAAHRHIQLRRRIWLVHLRNRAAGEARPARSGPRRKRKEPGSGSNTRI
jgi:ABC-type glutathione transport system ATPase component